MDERVPRTRAIGREEALALLARRYFRSHGPATLKDFVWWSGLSTTDARSGIENASTLVAETDEYLVAYADRSAACDSVRADAIFANTVVLDGRVVGTWKRTMTAQAIGVDVTLFGRVPKAALEREVQRFGAFHGRSASFQV